MSLHILVIDATEYNGFRFECPDGNGCAGWTECDGDHEGFDPEDETSPAFDQDALVIHGVEHEWRGCYGWTVPFDGCVAQEWNGDLPDELWDRENERWKPGRWLVEDDWDDDVCYLLTVPCGSCGAPALTEIILDGKPTPACLRHLNRWRTPAPTGEEDER